MTIDHVVKDKHRNHAMSHRWFFLLAAAAKAFQRKDANGDGFLDAKEFSPNAKKNTAKEKDV